MNNSASPVPMFKISLKLFYWKAKIQKNGNASLYIDCYISGIGPKADRKQHSLNLEWPAKKINLEKGILLPRHKDDLDVNDYHLIINDLKAKINEIAIRYRLQNRVLTNQLIVREILFYDASRSLVAFMQLVRKDRFRNGEIARQTYKNVLSTINSIIEFSPLAIFAEVDKNWMARYKKFLISKGVAINTIWTRLKDVKAHLDIAVEQHNIYVPRDGVEFPNPYKEEESVYLRKEEVIRLINQLDDQTLCSADYQVLKAFLFCCFTGFRISDLYNSEYSWMVSENFLKFMMVKNQARSPRVITIPLIPIAKRFISSNSGKFFELPTTQEYNRTLKQLMKLAEIDKKVSSHTARHTFEHLFMKFGGDIFTLKKILGHSKIETTQKYAHMDDDDNFDLVLKINDEFEDLPKIKRMG